MGHEMSETGCLCRGVGLHLACSVHQQGLLQPWGCALHWEDVSLPAIGVSGWDCSMVCAPASISVQLYQGPHVLTLCSRQHFQERRGRKVHACGWSLFRSPCCCQCPASGQDPRSCSNPCSWDQYADFWCKQGLGDSPLPMCN